MYFNVIFIHARVIIIYCDNVIVILNCPWIVIVVPVVFFYLKWMNKYKLRWYNLFIVRFLMNICDLIIVGEMIFIYFLFFLKINTNICRIWFMNLNVIFLLSSLRIISITGIRILVKHVGLIAFGVQRDYNVIIVSYCMNTDGHSCSKSTVSNGQIQLSNERSAICHCSPKNKYK